MNLLANVPKPSESKAWGSVTLRNDSYWHTLFKGLYCPGEQGPKLPARPKDATGQGYRDGDYGRSIVSDCASYASSLHHVVS